MDSKEELTINAIHPVRKKGINEEQKKLLALCPINESNDRLAIVKKIIPGVEHCIILENVLSPSECNVLVENSENIGFTFWDQTRQEIRKDFRDADTIEVHHPSLADELWNRMKPFVSEEFCLTCEHKYFQNELDGTWQTVGINEDMLIGRYKDGGHFAPHTDGCTVIDFNHRSLFTVLVYLNHCEKGGCTHIMEDEQLENLVLNEKGFYDGDPKYIIYSVPPTIGSALIFYHAYCHQGQPVEPGSRKYFIRTDVMFKRRIPILTAPEDKKAFEIYEMAKELSNEGKIEEATKFFKMAFRMSPGLSDVYKM